MHIIHYARDATLYNFSTRANITPTRHSVGEPGVKNKSLGPYDIALSNSSLRSFLDIFFIAPKPTVNQSRASDFIFYRAINKSLKIEARWWTLSAQGVQAVRDSWLRLGSLIVTGPRHIQVLRGGIRKHLVLKEENPQHSFINPLFPQWTVSVWFLDLSFLLSKKNQYGERHAYTHRRDSTDSANEDQLVRELFPTTVWKQHYRNTPLFVQINMPKTHAKQAEKAFCLFYINIYAIARLDFWKKVQCSLLVTHLTQTTLSL